MHIITYEHIIYMHIFQYVLNVWIYLYIFVCVILRNVRQQFLLSGNIHDVVATWYVMQYRMQMSGFRSQSHTINPNHQPPGWQIVDLVNEWFNIVLVSNWREPLWSILVIFNHIVLISSPLSLVGSAKVSRSRRETKDGTSCFGPLPTGSQGANTWHTSPTRFQGRAPPSVP